MLLSKDSKKSSKGKGKKRTKKTSQSQSNKKEMTKSASSNANMNNLKPVSFSNNHVQILEKGDNFWVENKNHFSNLKTDSKKVHSSKNWQLKLVCFNLIQLLYRHVNGSGYKKSGRKGLKLQFFGRILKIYLKINGFCQKIPVLGLLSHFFCCWSHLHVYTKVILSYNK